MDTPGTHLYFILLTVHVLYRRKQGRLTKSSSQESEVKHSVKSVFTAKCVIFMFSLINGRCLFSKLKTEFMGSETRKPRAPVTVMLLTAAIIEANPGLHERIYTHDEIFDLAQGSVAKKKRILWCHNLPLSRFCACFYFLTAVITRSSFCCCWN